MPPRSGRQRDERGLVRVFAHLRNRNGAQNIQNTFVDAAQRFANGTLFRGVAISVAGDTRGDEHRAINGRNHIESANLGWILGELIAAAGAMLGGNHGMMRQLLQHFGHQRRGNAILFGDFIGAAGVLLAVHRQMFYGDQTIVRFFRELEHRIELSQSHLIYD